MAAKLILVFVAIVSTLGPVLPLGIPTYNTHSVQSNQHHVQNPDGTYDFGYNTGEGSFQSEKKLGNVVSGQYGRQGPDGTFVNVQYQAPSGSNLKPLTQLPYSGPEHQQRGKAYVGAQPTGPITPAGTYLAGPGRPLAGYSQPGAGAFGVGPQGAGGFSYSFTASHDGSAASSGSTYRKPAGLGASAYRGEQVVPSVNLGPGGSYDFGYKTSEQYRTESRARDGSIRGQFGHAGPDGVRRNYAFEAGRGGYRVTGDDLPRQPEVPHKAYHSGHGSSAHRSHYSYPEDESPKPFQFSYNAGDHGRSEVQDAQGVVRGTYTVNAADGSLKEVSYKADDTGFTITDEKTIEGVRAPAPAQYNRLAYGGYGQAKAGKSAYAYTGPWN